jgi:hypothetical protein
MKSLRLGAGAVVLGVLAAGFLAAATPGLAISTANCTASQLIPVLGDFSANQGLGNYGYLVRGKETLVKFFLKNPTNCAVTSTQSINITGATLAVNNSATTFTGIGAFQSFSTAPAVTASVSTTSPADPLFVVPAADLTPGTGSATFNPTFTATVTYLRKDGKTTTSATTTFPNPVAVTFDHATGALRVLVVPMGDGTPGVPANTQFTPTDQTSTQNGFSGLSRIFPVPSGIAGVDASAIGGIRYVIDTSALLDLKSVPLAYNGPHFCGTGGNFDAIKAKLAQFMQSWNSNLQNSTKQVDRVLGVVGESISDGADLGCADGMASLVSPEAWVRAISDKPASGRTAAVPSRTGSLMAMELSHTWGSEPGTASHHSPNVNADGTNPGRAYNVATRSFLGTNRTVMKYSFLTSPPWDDTLTLLEPADYSFDRCALGGTTAGVADCSALGTTTGTTLNVAAGPSYIVSGTVNRSTNTAEIVQSGFLHSLQLGQEDASVYRYVRRDATGALETNIGFHVSFANTLHNNGADADPPTDEGLFSFALDDDLPGPPDDMAEVQLWKVASNVTDTYDPQTTAGDVLLYDKFQQDSPPFLSSISIGAAQQATNYTDSPSASELNPALTDDGTWIAWDQGNDETDYLGIKVAPVTDFSKAVFAPTPENASAEDPAWNAAGTALAYEASGDLYTQSVTRNGTTATFGTPVKIYDLISPSEGYDPAYHPTWSRDGGSIAFDSGGDLWTIPSAPAAPVHLADATRLTNTDDDEHDPSWSHTAGDNRIAFAFDSPSCFEGCTTAVYVLVPGNTDASLVSTDGSFPSFGTDGRIAFGTSGKNIWSAKADGSDAKQISTGGNDTAPSAAGNSFAFDRVFQSTICGLACFTVTQTDIMLTKITPGQQAVSFTATSTAPLKGELDYECGGVSYPVHVGLEPDQISGAAQTFNTNFDGSSACSGGVLKALVTDGVQYNTATGGGGVTPTVDPKPPTAAIFTPLAQAYTATATLPVSGTGYDAEGRVLRDSGLHWTLTLPDGTVRDLGTFASRDVRPGDLTPALAAWPGGTLRFTLVATDATPTMSPPVTRDVYVVPDFVGVGGSTIFLSPLLNPPGVNSAKPGTQFPIKWQLKDLRGRFVGDLATVREIAFQTDGNPPACNFTSNTGPFVPLPTGGTVLRYDTKNNQFVYNWTTPSTPGCYVFRLTLADGTEHQAWFKLS